MNQPPQRPAAAQHPGRPHPPQHNLQHMPPHGPQPPVGPRQHSPSSKSAFALSLVGFLFGLIPCVGFLGTIGILVAIRDLQVKDPPGVGLQRGYSVAALMFGTLSTIGAVVWLITLVSLGTAVATGSCPHVYAFDGDDYRLDADLASGAMYAGAELSDTDRLEHIRPIDGSYRIRIQNDLDETNYINSVALMTVEHDVDTEALPTPNGAIVPIRGARGPIRVIDDNGDDVSHGLAAHDGLMLQPLADSKAFSQSWTIDFERPEGSAALLVIRGHNTSFAEVALMRYMATMGRGVGPLMSWSLSEDCDCNREYIEDEIMRLGLPLKIEVSAAGKWQPAQHLLPVGPAALRSQALQIPLPSDHDDHGPLQVRLTATSRFWNIDHVALAASAEPLKVTRLEPSRAMTQGKDARTRLLARDDSRVVLSPGQRIDVEFDASPSQSNMQRTVMVALSGYYEVPIGGKFGVDPLVVIAHQLGFVSLPEFAKRQHSSAPNGALPQVARRR